MAGQLRHQARSRGCPRRFRVPPLFAAGIGLSGDPRLRLDSIAEWIDHRGATGRLRPHVAAHYCQLAARHIVSRLGHVPLVRISPVMVRAFHAALAHSGLAPATVRQVASILRAALREAVSMGLVAKNPCDQVPLPPAPDPEIAPPSLEQLHAYLADARETATPAVFAFYVAMAASGARPGELLGAPEDAFDPRAGTLRIARTLTRPGAAPAFAPPKTRQGARTILLPPEAVEAIKAALRWKREQKLRLGERFRDAGLLFCTPTGRPIDRRLLRARDHLPRLKRLGLPPMRIYDLRHLHATRLVAAGVDWRTAADRLGHADPGYMIRRYAHAVAEAQQKATDVARALVALLPARPAR